MSLKNAILHTNVSIIEAADRITLDTLIADLRTGQFILNRLSDCVAVVAPGQFDLLLEALKKDGHTPRVREK